MVEIEGEEKEKTDDKTKLRITRKAKLNKPKDQAESIMGMKVTI